ncbi:MAG: protoporphyrinogen oxidase [Gemmataceae bacterium]
MANVVVIGAGISGLAVAHALEQRRPDLAVHVLESAPRPGGKIATSRRDGFLVEHGPNGFLDNNPATLDLARRVGLGDRLVAASDVAGLNRFLLLGGKLRKLPSSLLSFLGTDLLSWTGKLDLLMERFRRRRTSGEESIDAFARRRAGREVARTLADPFVTGILAGDPKLLSMQASFPRLAGFERDHGSVTAGMAAARRGTGRAKMWSFPGGLQELVDAVAGSLRRPVRVGVAVRSITPTAAGWRVALDGETLDAAAVVLACPADAQAGLLGFDPALAELVGGIAYTRIAVVALGYRRADVPHPLDGFGYLTPQRDRHDVLGAQWCSSIYPGRAPEGAVLVRALCGGWNRADVADRDDAGLVAAARAQLRQTVGVTAEPVFREVVRWDRAIPQYFVGHLGRLERIEQRRREHPGLFLAGNAYRGVAMNDCVERGTAVADEVATLVLPR